MSQDHLKTKVMMSYDDLITYLRINLKTIGLSVNPNWAQLS